MDKRPDLKSLLAVCLSAGVLLAVVAVFASTTDAPVLAAEKAPVAGGFAKHVSDWPMYGGTWSRNMVNLVDKGILDDWSTDKKKEKNIKWKAALGTCSYGGPTVAAGRIFVGTNNAKPRDPASKGDRGVVMCFDEKTGEFLWQMVHEKLDNTNENDWPEQGVPSTPVVDGELVYYVSNRCEMVCLDVKGDPKSKKGKVIWTYDFMKKEGVYPHMLAFSSPLVAGDLVFAVTSNGVESQDHKIINPKAPSFIALNKKTGALAWKSNLPGEKIMAGQWTSPAYAEVGGQGQVIFPGGDGWLYSFEAKSGTLLWKFDCNPKKSVFKPGGRGTKSYFIATPVVYDNKVYIATGQNPDDGGGEGHLWCIDITKKPANKEMDLSPVEDNFDPKADVNKASGLVWHYGGAILPKPKTGRELVFGRTLSTCCIVDDLLYIAELDGYLHCVDAKTGKMYWVHDFKTSVWGSAYYVDGKILQGTEDGKIVIFQPGKTYKEPKEIEMEGSVKGTPVACRGVLYVMTDTTLYAIAPAGK